MNEMQLYNDLVELTEDESGSFFFVDNSLDGVVYRIFSYRSVWDYSKWLLNDAALECRGITFEMDDDLQPTCLVSWPFEKFFNVNENPLSSNLELSAPTEIVVKKDGSLISSLCHKGDLRVKSKGSLHSEVAVAANSLIRQSKYRALYTWTLDWARRGYTVIFEYTSPLHRIVVPYEETSLTVLAVPNHADGSYVDIFQSTIPSEIRTCLAENLAQDIDDPMAFIQNIAATKGMEGYVLEFGATRENQDRLVPSTPCEQLTDISDRFWLGKSGPRRPC